MFDSKLKFKETKKFDIFVVFATLDILNCVEKGGFHSTILVNSEVLRRGSLL
jgi:hypothetical protein